MQIRSLQNNRVKNVVKLNSRRHRDAQQHTVVEGVREVQQALAAGMVPAEIYICPPLLNDAELDQTLQQVAQQHTIPHYEVTPDIFAKIAYRGDSGGVVMIVPYFARTLETLPVSKRPFLVVIEGGQKPGNIGAILRSADGAGVDGLVLCESSKEVSGTDIHNPNVVRASLGAVFTVPVAMADSAAVISWLQQQQIQIVATTPAATQRYTAVDMTQPTALVMGSEAWGLSSQWLHTADQQVVIPMLGTVDSLNLSVSAALLMYEAIRQRQLTH